ncbi:MAG: aminopeptidase P family protein [Acinetobacter sp.]|nr:aminopeptidase P family protein [Acinetobacter sp.]
MTSVTQRLAALRQALKTHGLNAWIVPSADPHLSEYFPDHWDTRSWLSGFTGSVGTLVVTEQKASLWVDSRYFEQATHQLQGSGIDMDKLGFGKTHIDWLVENVAENGTVGVAPDMLSLAAKRALETAFTTKNIRLQATQDIVNDFWTDRPALPKAKIYPHEVRYVSETAASKLARVRQAMQEKHADAHLISSMDDIAWLTNLRGSDVSYNPVFLAHLLISHEQATLFVDAEKLATAEQNALQQAGIQIADYHQVANALAHIQGKLLLDPNKVAISTLQQLTDDVQLVESINPSTLFKSVKSPQDIAFIREAMIEDGVALCGFFAELEQKIANNDPLNELDISDMLIAHRSQRAGYISPSFGTIAGFNANGALPHYSATPEAYSEIQGNGLLLIDSGAQYQSGTTDITRVVAIRDVNAQQKRDFTLVLKAHIALATTVFPEGILSPMIDAICRKPLWEAQCDYGHGTGHGVGYFMNVHEGPQVISYHAMPNPNHAFKAGMFTSNEPGLYRPGKWGIRIENLVINQPVAQPQETEFGSFLYFETVTLCPIDTRLVEPSLMTAQEIQWLNDYHAEVRAKLESRTEGDAKAWLIQATEAI